MLGLAILAGLAFWCILTLLAMIIGFKVFRYIKKSWLSGLLGVFTGFMLLMGGWFVYWILGISLSSKNRYKAVSKRRRANSVCNT